MRLLFLVAIFVAGGYFAMTNPVVADYVTLAVGYASQAKDLLQNLLSGL
jgi:hypothetical protein